MPFKYCMYSLCVHTNIYTLEREGKEGRKGGRRKKRRSYCPADAGFAGTTGAAALLRLCRWGREEAAISTLSAQNRGH